MTFFINRPYPVEYRQWTGSNLTELQGWVQAGITLTLQGDGSLTSSNGYTIYVTNWISQVATPQTDPDLQGYSQLAGPPPVLYALTSDIGNLYVPQRRSVTVAVPALILLQKTTVNVTWSSPMPSATYDIGILPVTSATLVGATSNSLVSQTASGCVIAVQALLGLSLGQVNLRVSAIN